METVLTVPCISTPLPEVPVYRPIARTGYNDSLGSLSSTILLVEDNPAHADLVMRSFENHPLARQIVHLTDGEQALNYLFRRNAYVDPKKSPRPHVVLLDLNLPGVDGLNVLAEIKASETLCSIPVVIMTTSSHEEDVDRAYRLHANSFLIKPFDFDQFTEAMRLLAAYWLDENYYPYS